MFKIEVKTALLHPMQVLSHPRWIGAYLSKGRAGLLRQMVDDSIRELRQSPSPSSIEEVVASQLHSSLGKIGAIQEYLYRLVRFTQPEKIVETGVYRGVSSSYVLAALEDNGKGRLFSIDLPQAKYRDPVSGRLDNSPLIPGEEVGFAIPSRLRSRWQLRLGDAREELPRLLADLGTIQLFIHDSEHTYQHMTWEFELAYQHLPAGGFLVSDDVNWNDSFHDFVSKHDPSWSMVVKNRLGIARV